MYLRPLTLIEWLAESESLIQVNRHDNFLKLIDSISINTQAV